METRRATSAQSPFKSTYTLIGPPVSSAKHSASTASRRYSMRRSGLGSLFFPPHGSPAVTVFFRNAALFRLILPLCLSALDWLLTTYEGISPIDVIPVEVFINIAAAGHLFLARPSAIIAVFAGQPDRAAYLRCNFIVPEKRLREATVVLKRC